MELFKCTLSDNKKVYAVGQDEYEARDKVSDWLKKRFPGGAPVQIGNVELLAEDGSKGYVPLLIL